MFVYIIDYINIEYIGIHAVGWMDVYLKLRHYNLDIISKWIWKGMAFTWRRKVIQAHPSHEFSNSAFILKKWHATITIVLKSIKIYELIAAYICFIQIALNFLCQHTIPGSDQVVLMTYMAEQVTLLS